MHVKVMKAVFTINRPYGCNLKPTELVGVVDPSIVYLIVTEGSEFCTSIYLAAVSETVIVVAEEIEVSCW